LRQNGDLDEGEADTISQDTEVKILRLLVLSQANGMALLHTRKLLMVEGRLTRG
jgi:hypothetical protein